MQATQNLALIGAHPSDVITEVLGVVAVCSFIGIAFYIGFILFRDTHRKRAVGTTHTHSRLQMPQTEEKRIDPAEAEAKEERTRAERRLADLYYGVLETGTQKLEELSLMAKETFQRIAEAYASNSYGLEGETSKVRAKRFGTVCERQWGFMRADIGFMSHLDIHEHLRHILENHRLLISSAKPKENEAVDVNPEHLRFQELVSLVRVVSKDKVKALQHRVLDAVEGFGHHYEKELSKWISDVSGKLTAELRRKKPGSLDISETEYYEMYKRLRTHLEIASYLSERISQNTQRVSEDSLAFSQLIYVGTLLRILTSMPEWFAELELTPNTSEEEAVEAGASVNS